jgi:hypothetical protein
MSSGKQREIENNFSYFQSIVGSLVSDHAGEFALIRSREIIDFFPSAIDAMSEGHHRFSDGIYSIQRVIDRPLDLGFLSYGANDRIFA